MRRIELLRDERGVALVVAVLALAMLSALGTTIVYFANSGFRSATVSRSQVGAQSLAEAGVDMARSTLYSAASYLDPNAVPEQTVSLNGGTVTYSGALAGNIWTLVGTGSVRNPTGPGASPISRTVTSRVAIETIRVGTENNGAWNYLFAASPTTCTTVSSNITLPVSIYVNGNLCIRSNSKLTGPHVGVTGQTTLAANSSIGTISAPIARVDVTGGCRYKNGSWHSPCTSADRVYAQTITTEPFAYTKPPVDLAYWYANAKPGPMHGCSQGSFPGGFDNNTTMNTSRGAVNLMPAAGYDCSVADGEGKLLGRIAWTPGNPGTLTIAGTVFFDGRISIPSNTHGLYQGRGTIYTSSRIIFSSNADLCVTSGCVPSGWDTSVNLLAMVAGEASTSNGISVASNSGFQGALYAVNDYSEASNSRVGGPVIARQIALASNSHHSAPIGELLAGMPATYTETIGPVNVDGGWSG